MQAKRILCLAFSLCCLWAGCNSTSGDKSVGGSMKLPFVGEGKEKEALRKQVEKDSFPAAGSSIGAARS